MKTESQLKSELGEAIKKLESRAVWLRHEDKISAGIPDISITTAGRTLWVEAKRSDMDGRWKTRGIQHLTCKRLADVGLCYYVIYRYDLDCVDVVLPYSIQPPGSYRAEERRARVQGFDQMEVAKRLLEVIRDSE